MSLRFEGGFGGHCTVAQRSQRSQPGAQSVAFSRVQGPFRVSKLLQYPNVLRPPVTLTRTSSAALQSDGEDSRIAEIILVNNKAALL